MWGYESRAFCFIYLVLMQYTYGEDRMSFIVRRYACARQFRHDASYGICDLFCTYAAHLNGLNDGAILSPRLCPPETVPW